MDSDVQQHYLAAEQAYGDGDFAQAESIANTLLTQLEAASGTEAEEEARLAWRASSSAPRPHSLSWAESTGASAGPLPIGTAKPAA